ncbi:MAG: alpha/beta hydrolase [Thermoguttaceae bacterium]
MKRIFLTVLAFCVVGICSAQSAEDRPLWTKDVPHALGTEAKDIPKVTVWLPTEPQTKAAVVVCPGGGYGGLAMDHEGKQIAEWLNSFGVAAFVLDYRHRGKGYGHPVPREDVQRAIRLVRASAAEYKIDPSKIGVLGFSAGGHLASTAATHFDLGKPDAADPIDRVSCRPDFAVLCYPVITFGDEYTHRGSRQNLLGKENEKDAALVEEYSNELRVTDATPPTFIFFTDEDTAVPPENGVLFYMALRKHKVPAEMHIFRVGRHGIGLGRDIAGSGEWSKLCETWMRNIGVVE